MFKLIERIDAAGPADATLTLSFDLRQRSRLRVRLDDGREAALLLARGTVLRGGDRLRADDGTVVGIVAAPEPVSTVACSDPHQLARACYHLGNRHVALQIGAGWLRYQGDHVLDDLARELGLQPRTELAPFEPEAGAYGHEPAPVSAAAAAHGHTAAEVMEEATTLSPALLSLLRLTSSSLPIGSFAYSQGMEYAVERGWIADADTARDWIAGLLRHALRWQDLPLFARLYRAWQADDAVAVVRWNARVLAAREARELHAEEGNVGVALARLLADLGIARAAAAPGEHAPGYLAMFALACVEWRIPLSEAAGGLLWAWSQNQVAAAIKLVPLGQTAGQRILQELVALIPPVVQQALTVADDDIGYTAPGLALASARHEGQYTRLFLS